MNRTFESYAHEAIDRGHRIFPLIPNAKKPSMEGWQRLASRNHDQAQTWWAENRLCNIAILTGETFVIDLDPPKEEGQEHGVDIFWRLLCDNKIPWQPTSIVDTPSGGQHQYFRPPRDLRLRNTRRTKLGQNIDTRGYGGYVVAPGSMIDGNRYKIRDESVPIVGLPEGLVQMLTREVVLAKAAGIARPFAGYLDPRVTLYLKPVLQSIDDAPKGRRNDALYAAARSVGRLVGGGHIDREYAEGLLISAAAKKNSNHDFPPSEYIPTVHSGLNCGEPLPLHLFVLPSAGIA